SEMSILNKGLSYVPTFATDPFQIKIELFNKNSDIVIKPADKGGGLVLVNTSDYVVKSDNSYLMVNFIRSYSLILLNTEKAYLMLSGIGSLTESLSNFIDAHIRPLVVQLPSYLRDTGDFLEHLSNIQERNDYIFGNP
uniref:Uncharacterized protein n=1 Tax=Sinocyclocheilus grahami TaxID=75366 RepID=A0A672PV89_SINGR